MADSQKLLARWIPRPLLALKLGAGHIFEQLILTRNSDGFYCAAVPHNGSHGSGKLRGQMFCYLPSQIRAAKKGQNTSGDKKVIWPGGIRPGESTVVSDLPLSTTLKLAILRKRQDYPKEQKSRMLCGQRDRSG